MSHVCAPESDERTITDQKLCFPNHLLTVKQFCVKFPWPTESALRSYIYRADELKMTKIFLRIGRRVLIDVNGFFDFVQKEGASHG